MLIPKYWSSTKKTLEWTVEQYGRPARRQRTIHRLGWSNHSQEDADKMANERLEEAIKKGVDEKNKREPKVPYNGADGVPIREEILKETNEGVLTRNSYGAVCLNVPDVLIVDIDKENIHWSKDKWWVASLLLALMAGGVLFFGFDAPIKKSFIALCLVLGVCFLARIVFWEIFVLINGGLSGLIKKRAGKIKDVSFRIYQTPNGFRLIETTKVHAPKDALVSDIFEYLWADPLYAAMCKKQNCFRARVTGKPWRMGMDRMPQGVWPIAEEKKEKRQEWVLRYTEKAKYFSACRFVGQTSFLGQETGNEYVDRVVRFHDELCAAQEEGVLA